MTRHLKVAGLALLAVLFITPFASARPPGFGFRGGFGYGPRFYGPTVGFGWYGGPDWYGAGWYEPYGYVPGATAGKVKIQTKAKDSMVYVDGGYAGTVKQLGTFPLVAGTHSIELRAPNGQSFYQQQVDVVAGRTMDLKP